MRGDEPPIARADGVCDGMTAKTSLVPLGFAALAAIALAGCSSGTPEASVQDTTPIKVLTGDAFLIGLGLQPADRGRPDNTPRPSLVLPPDSSLPSPETETALTTNAAWPRDPDVERAERIARLRAQDTGADPDHSINAIRQTPNTQTAASGSYNPTISDEERLRRNTGADKDESGLSTISAAQLRRETEVARQIRSLETPGSATRQRSLIAPPGTHTVPSPDAPLEVPKKDRKRRFIIF